MECGLGLQAALVLFSVRIVMLNRYQIIVAGRLDAERSRWFDGHDIRYHDGVTTLSGTVVDAQALYGLIERLRDLGLSLIEVRPVSETGLEGKED